MDNLFGFIVLGIPGILTYILMQKLGISNNEKKEQTELLALSAILWVPSVILSVVFFDLLYLLTDLFLKSVDINFSKLGINLVVNVKDLMKNIESFVFVFYFIITIVVSCFLVSFSSGYVYKYFLKFINSLRKRRNFAKLSDDTSAFHKFFSLHHSSQIANNDGEYPLVAEIYFIDAPNDKFYGSITYAPASSSSKFQLIIEETDSWEEFIKGFKELTEEDGLLEGKTLPILRRFFDIEAKIVINEIDQSALYELIDSINNNQVEEVDINE
ncbi:hypothetical protein V7138_00655 [Bacillus sp. JJ1533]|uniref:hypothetical protein n=1 Tax=Bacillus sp. JJ1533 TaxID=3122959 RepID=UPI00300096C8